MSREQRANFANPDVRTAHFTVFAICMKGLFVRLSFRYSNSGETFDDGDCMWSLQIEEEHGNEVID
jgi:hypothetical protein